ncbi:MAG: hypothetical protein K8T10_16860 [Candidatus Eremiobacteraeota bacterium]|nr:hypothetical protein [Candidatus Eremiobacteraeota bacterium]
MKQLITIIITLLIIIFLQSNNPIFSEESDSFLFSPAKSSFIYSRKPTISLAFRNLAIKLNSVKVLINNKDVTASSIILPGFMSYKPGVDLPFGENRVEVHFTDKSEKKYSISWMFQIKSFDLIKSINHDYKPPLMIREILHVTMKGKPGGEAFFDISGLKTNIPMKEVSPGLYKGSYRVGKFDYTTNVYIYGNLRMPDGKYEKMKAKTPVSIIAQLFEIKILSPKDGELVAQKFTIKGRTKPNVDVLMTISLSFRQLGGLISGKGPEQGGIETRSDSNGYFSKEFGFPVSVNGLKAVINIQARDSEGIKSISDEVSVFLDVAKDREHKEKKGK